MGIQTMGSQGGGEGSGKRSQLQPIARQNSVYSLTLDEVQNQLADLGKPLSSMNLDELLKNVWTVEASQSARVDNEGTTQAGQASLPLSGALSMKTVDEVWRDIQENKDGEEKKSRERQPTLGEMTLEDFLAKAGIVAEASLNTTTGIDSNAAVPQFPPQGHWIQYSQQQQLQQQQQFQLLQQNLMGTYMPSQSIAQPLHMGAGASLDVPFADSQVALSSSLMGTLSDTQRKRSAPEEMVEKTVERRHKRMIKNRESAARSRARKQAYTNELENKVSRLEEENERLRKQKELENMLPCAPPPEPKYQLRRIASSPL